MISSSSLFQLGMVFRSESPTNTQHPSPPPIPYDTLGSLNTQHPSPPPIPHDTLGSLLATARDLHIKFEKITEGSSTQYLRKIGAESSKKTTHAGAILMLETSITEMESLQQSLQECSARILDEEGCSFEWWEVGKIEREVRTVVHGLQEILCDFL